jgi:hypothetical protein
MSEKHLRRTLQHITEQLNQGTLVLPRKIQCRNAYERRVVHEWAETFGLAHVTTIDYSTCHYNRREEKTDDSKYSTLVYSKTPQSFVTLTKKTTKSDYSKVIIGEPKVIHTRHRRVYSSGIYWSDYKEFAELDHLDDISIDVSNINVGTEKPFQYT